MLVRFNKLTQVNGTAYGPASGDVDLANDLADEVVRAGNGVIVGMGAVSSEVQWDSTRTGLVDPVTGVEISLTRVYTTTLTLSVDTSALASGSIIPLDQVLIDDLGMADATVIGRINIPPYVKKIRVTARASYKYDAATAGTYRSCTITVSPTTNAPTIKSQPFPSVGSSTMAPSSTVVTGLIDVAGLGWDISAGTAYIQMLTSHDGNAAPPILPAASKSFLTVEMYV